MIIIEDASATVDYTSILNALGKEGFYFLKEGTLEDCLYPKDKSISFGRYGRNLLICDDFQITNKSLDYSKDLSLIKEEKALCHLFPDSEIISIACHSVVNYHAYSIIKKGKKIRFKSISTQSSLIEFGPKIEEEKKIYAAGFQRAGQYFWEDENDPDYEYTEDQLMEDFTFAIAKRRLGVFLDQEEADDLMFKVPFQKYKSKKWKLLSALFKK